MTKIYDCFPFRNEFDLLDLRLELLYDHVDYFVLVEANTTFTSIDKPFYFEENKSKYEKYLDKIIHVKVQDMPRNTDPWVNDCFQRNALFRGVQNADANDIIIIEDADEILRPEVVKSLRTETRNYFAFRTPYFNFKFNYMLVENPEYYCVWTMACRKNILETVFFAQPDFLRLQRFQYNALPFNFENNQIKVYEHAGWHFSYLGDTAWVKHKLKSFAHSEFSGPETLEFVNVEKSIKNSIGFNPNGREKFQAVCLDEYFPSVIKNRYSDFIIEGHDEFPSITSFLPTPYIERN